MPSEQNTNKQTNVIGKHQNINKPLTTNKQRNKHKNKQPPWTDQEELSVEVDATTRSIIPSTEESFDRSTCSCILQSILVNRTACGCKSRWSICHSDTDRQRWHKTNSPVWKQSTDTIGTTLQPNWAWSSGRGMGLWTSAHIYHGQCSNDLHRPQTVHTYLQQSMVLDHHKNQMMDSTPTALWGDVEVL